MSRYIDKDELYNSSNVLSNSLKSKDELFSSSFSRNTPSPASNRSASSHRIKNKLINENAASNYLSNIAHRYNQPVPNWSSDAEAVHSTIQNSDEPPSYEELYNESKEKPDSRPLGLPNSKTFCYMNSVIQSLRHCQDFVSAILHYKIDYNKLSLSNNQNDVEFISAFLILMSDLAYGDKDKAVKSSLHFQELHKNFPDFATGEQDADEYLQFLLNKLNDAMKTKQENKPKKYTIKACQNVKTSCTEANEFFKKFLKENDSLTARLFCGLMNNQINCKKCSFSKPLYQIFWVLSVSGCISSGDSNLSSCIENMMTSDEVDVKECPHCHKSRTISLKTEVTHWPKYLIIHVKQQISPGEDRAYRSLISWNIDDPLILPQIKSKHPVSYQLLGVIDHIGTIMTGHYFAKFRDLNDDNIWWCLNDTNVYKIRDSQHEVITSHTVTYFFQQKTVLSPKAL